MALSDQEVKDIANKAAGNVMERKGGAICECVDWFLVAMTAAEALEHNATVSDMARDLHEALKEIIPKKQLEDLEFKHVLLQGYLTENIAEMALSGSLGSIRDKCEVDIAGVKELADKGFDAVKKRDPAIAASSFTKVKVELLKLAGEVCAKEESNPGTPGRVRFDRTEGPFRAKPTRADVEVIIHGGDGTPYSVEVVHKKTGETVADMEWGEMGVDAEDVLDYLETIDLLAGEGNPGNPGNPVAKEPWQMTLEEYAYAQAEKYGHGKPRIDWIKAGYGETYRSHKTAVERALREGKAVPAEVLADYPDLK